ncbi:hypothetical protein Psed_7015 (plasmid) [Pseudonocardia dioxanivorans CB1190]|uniref:Uncharacterized protein n=1 Tax=Pseudonocardia dioxanivorans (strain ATCC 55486 / DSM 44775 / JCM 13855 / CB1190) TaxID=675635 RepID=F2L799_PSEUX|nr:hypothetical protein [Pseudonocardia dioxanivorans]AEA29072.1 hypothetical protein Psed_7015 [Pseudonocardia dioxanivorans CB1190]
MSDEIKAGRYEIRYRAGKQTYASFTDDRVSAIRQLIAARRLSGRAACLDHETQKLITEDDE